MTEEKEYVKMRNWALLDIEFIQCTHTHKCVRKLYMLAKDGYMDLLLEFFPCKPLHIFSKKDQSERPLSISKAKTKAISFIGSRV